MLARRMFSKWPTDQYELLSNLNQNQIYLIQMGHGVRYEDWEKEALKKVSEGSWFLLHNGNI